jgi:hypothetical protein
MYVTDECPVCFENNTLFLDACGHTICYKCYNHIKNKDGDCPMCRTKIRSYYYIPTKSWFIKSEYDVGELAPYFKALYNQVDVKYSCTYELISEYFKYLSKLSSCTPPLEIAQLWRLHTEDVNNYKSACMLLVGKYIECPININLSEVDNTIECYNKHFGQIEFEYLHIWEKSLCSSNDADYKCICVKNATGLNTTVYVILDIYVYEFKIILRNKGYGHEDYTRIIWNGKQLQDEKKLSNYGIKTMDTLYLFGVLRGC